MTQPLIPAPTRNDTRRLIADRLLDSLDEIVRRHRALALHGLDASAHSELHVELIAAEVAHQLAMTRSAAHRHPPLRPAS